MIPSAFFQEAVKLAAGYKELIEAARRVGGTRSRGLAGQLGAVLIPTKKHMKQVAKNPGAFGWQKDLLPEELMKRFSSRYSRYPGRIFYGSGVSRMLNPRGKGEGTKTLALLHEALERKAPAIGKSLHGSPSVLVEELNLLNRATAPKGKGKSLIEAVAAMRSIREPEHALLREQFQQVFKDPRALKYLEPGQRVPAAMKRKFLRDAPGLPDMDKRTAQALMEKQVEWLTAPANPLLTQLDRAKVVKGVFRKKAAGRLPPSTLPRPRDIPIHAQQRAVERTKVHPGAVAKLQRRLGQLKLEKGKTYHHPWPEGGYAVIAPVGKRGRKHVVKTTLAPHMSPPGYRLPPFPS